MDEYSAWHALTGETGPAPKEEEMECVDCGAKCADVSICNDCNDARRVRCDRTAERRALAREAYMAALPMLAANESAENATGCAAEVALETVRRWDAFMAAVDAEDLLRKSEINNDLG